uniref:uncharacterized protein LOC122604741 n=1 Tax=Erigeron canadensis TaxID=72917 RepID=UPI001CB8D82A|nr:uncharacterized protein LOC122604741 [Erigeron canadensis]
MDFASLPSFYFSAPTSPTSCNLQTPKFYSTWSSPFQPFGSGSGAEKSKVDEFQFETGRGFDDQWDQEDQEYKLPARANSFSTIAFADELFCNGQVMPLKLPPRLQTSVPTSPRSFSSRVRNPFGQRCTWNDGFDPFLIALEKVSEEPEGRVSVHRRSRSYSPFRARSISCRVACAGEWDHGQEKEPRTVEMLERKGSMYSRWVRSQTMVKKNTELSMQHSPTARTMMKRLLLGQNKPVKPTKQSDKESKLQKVKSVLFRYAESLKKETSESKQSREKITISKMSHFKRLSLSLKTNRRKKESVETKMAIVKQDMKVPRCLGYPSISPRWL